MTRTLPFLIIVLGLFTLSWGLLPFAATDSASAYGRDNSFLFQSSDTIHIARYTIDRSQVPPLTHNELTLTIPVGEVDRVQVKANGSSIAHVYDPTRGMLRFTTDASTVELILANASNLDALGTISKAVLKDDKAFAWSLGMDDNTGLRATAAVLEQYGWQGTFFLIGSIVDDVRDEDWIVDAPYIHQKLASGWAIGNHGWESDCGVPINEPDILNGYNRLQQVVDSSSRPSYRIIGFAAPCFVSEYHPVILNHRNNQTTPVQFNESGDKSTLIVDPGVTDNIYPDDNPHDPLAWAFNYDLAIGRDTYIEVSQPQSLIEQIDWMAARYAQFGEHMWQNTLVHGGHEADIATVAAYLDSTYGPNGTNQLWVAPSDQIYSYLMVRDRATVTLISVEPSDATPTPAATATSTPIPIAQPTATSAAQPTATSIATSTPVATPTDGTGVGPTPDCSKVLHLPIITQ